MREAIEAGILRAAEAIAPAGELAVACHVSPDGDALGSVLALCHAARSAGKAAVASFGSPFVVAAHFRFLGLEPLVPPSQFPAAPPVMVAVDVASPDRLAELGSAAARAGTLILLDHHASNPGFGDVVVVDPSAAASAKLAYRLIRALGWPIDTLVATDLFAGIVADTGSFQYSSTDGEVMRIAAELIDAGARPEMVGQNLFESLPFGYLSVSSAVLGRARLEEGCHLVWSVLYLDDVRRAGVGLEDLEPIIDDLRVIQEAEVTALFKEASGRWRVSLRSKGTVDVGAVAVAEGGGGHRAAAGFDFEGSLEAAVERLRGHLRG